MTFLLGGVDNGRHATLVSALYSGEVGVRARSNGQVDLAWFGKPPTLTQPVSGTLDGAAVTITDLRSRPITSGSPALLQANPIRANVATTQLS